jgi:hypothetical protein
VELADVAAIAAPMMTTTISSSWSRTFIPGAIAPNPGADTRAAPPTTIDVTTMTIT